ncbi:response regulator transcription factor [Mycoplasmatota bacterium WC44]
MDKTILIIEDELALLNILEVYFKKEGYQVITADDGLAGLEKFSLHKIDLVIVDILLPHVNGWDIVKSIRQKSNLPIIMVTALSSEEDQLKGYDLDIDDYVTKPFSPSVLVKKVNKTLNRFESNLINTVPQNHKLGLIEINFDKRLVLLENSEISLSKTEFDILAYFIKNQSVVIDRVTFLDEIWGMDVYVEDRIVDTFIKTLRKKLGPASNYIKTVFGVGYKFEVLE